MTQQIQDSKEQFAKIKSDQGILVNSLIMQALNAARAINAHFSIWADKDGDLMVSAADKRKGGYIRFSGSDIKNEDIDDLIGIVEWLLNGAPEEKDEEETDDE